MKINQVDLFSFILYLNFYLIYILATDNFANTIFITKYYTNYKNLLY